MQTLVSGGLRGRLFLRIEQAMQMDDEITHVSVVDSLLCLGLPSRQRARIVGIHADDIEFVEVTELDFFEVFQFTTEDEVQELLLPLVSVIFVSFYCRPSALHLRDFDGKVNRLVGAKAGGETLAIAQPMLRKVPHEIPRRGCSAEHCPRDPRAHRPPAPG